MSFVITIWLLSLFILIAITAFAFYSSRATNNLADTPEDLNEFIREAFAHIIGNVAYAAVSAKPHADRVAAFFYSYGKLGHEIFTERVFGRLVREPGNAASFFLKYIAEHKENTKGSAMKKRGY
jgi:hypothetical protein